MIIREWRSTGMAGVVWLAGLLLGGQVQAWTALDQTESWSAPGTAGWSNSVSGVALTNSAGALAVAFSSQFTPRFVGGLAKRAVDPGTLLTAISFRLVSSNTPPSQLALCLHSRLSSNTWYYSIVPPAAGGEIDCHVPVAYTEGWRMGPLSTPEGFQQDIQTVDWIGVYIRRGGDPAAQTVTLDDFRLQGESWPEDRDLDGMENDWETRYGLSQDDPRDAGADGDHDGMSNYAEARAGTDPTNSASRFLVHLEMSGGGGGGSPRAMVWWNSITNRSYTVWRTTRLGDPFTPVRVGMAASPATNVFEDVAVTNAGGAFYHVDVDP